MCYNILIYDVLYHTCISCIRSYILIYHVLYRTDISCIISYLYNALYNTYIYTVLYFIIVVYHVSCNTYISCIISYMQAYAALTDTTTCKCVV